MKVVIRAGGIGSRLWPISRATKPKQLHALIGRKTMLSEALARALKVVKAKDIYISANEKCAAALRREIKGKIKNIIIEPARRDTAAAVGLETLLIAKQDPRAIIASLGSDHSIKRVAEFNRLLKVGEKFLQKYPHYLLCLGVRPSNPDIGYGYIELGQKIRGEVYAVKRFKEKPKLAAAKKFVRAGNYLWNGNMFMWRADTILSLFKRFQPKMYQQLMLIARQPKLLQKIYPQIEKIAIDYAILEKTKKIAALPADIGWNDIGDWARLKDELAEHPEDNVVKANQLGWDNENSLIYAPSEKLIVTLGLKNMLVVDSPDALLVADKKYSQAIKEVVDQLKKKKKNKYL